VPTLALAEKIESVVVIGHYENAIGTTDAASAGSVTAKLLQNRPALRTGEMLEFVPGVIVTQHSGDGKANQYFLRGFNLDHGTDFLTTVGGMPVNMRTHAHGQGYSDLNFVIPELVERIDYSKGPYYAEFGDFANAGAAQMRLFNTLPRGIASLTVGENQYTRALLADSVDTGSGSLLFGLDLARNDGPWRQPENLHRSNAVLRYSQFDSDGGFSVTGMAYRSRWDATDQIPQRAVDSGLVDRFGTLDDSDGGETHRYSLSFEGEKNTDTGRSAIQLYAVRSELNLFSNFTYQLDNPADLGSTIDGDQFEQAEQRDLFGLHVSHTFNGTLAGRRSDTTLGIEARRDDLAPVALYGTERRVRREIKRSDEVQETSGGVYVSNSSHWNDWLRTTLGARFDAYDFDVDSSIAANSGSANDSIVSPKASAIFGPWAKTELFLNYGEGFHSNDARGTTQRVNLDGSAADPVTPLVKSRGAEIGARTEIIPGLQSSLAIWQLDLDSELLFVGDAGDTEPNRASERYGVEWNNHYIASEWLLIDFDLSLSHARFTKHDPTGDHIPGAVEKVASLGFSLVDLGPWFAQLQLRYFGPRPLIEDDSVRSQSTFLTYLRAGYRFDEQWKIGIDIFNLFDRRASDIDYFYTSRLPGEDGGGVDDRHFHPVEPRTVRASVVYSF
jgi:outer membrane receptor protein involved in Fe transport